MSRPKGVEIAKEPSKTPPRLEIGNQQPEGKGGGEGNEQISWVAGTVSRPASSGSRAKRVERGRDGGRLVCLQSWSQPATVRRVWSSMPGTSEGRWSVWRETKNLPSGIVWSQPGHTSFHPNHATTESGFYAVQAHRRRPTCLSRYLLHEALRLRRLGYLDRGCSRRSVPMG